MLTIGMDLTLESERNGMLKKYKSKVADLSETTVSIYYPMSIPENKPAFLPAASKVTVHFVYGKSNLVKFNSEVIGMKKSTVPLIDLYLPEPSQFEKVQRREHVRVDALIDITCEFPEAEKPFTTVTDNISAGGCAVINPPNIVAKQGETGTVTFTIGSSPGKQKKFFLACEIIRVFTKEKRNLISLKFIDPSYHDVQLLTRFCFEKQLENRKKGLLT